MLTHTTKLALAGICGIALVMSGNTTEAQRRGNAGGGSQQGAQGNQGGNRGGGNGGVSQNRGNSGNRGATQNRGESGNRGQRSGESSNRGNSVQNQGRQQSERMQNRGNRESSNRENSTRNQVREQVENAQKRGESTRNRVQEQAENAQERANEQTRESRGNGERQMNRGERGNGEVRGNANAEVEANGEGRVNAEAEAGARGQAEGNRNQRGSERLRNYLSGNRGQDGQRGNSEREMNAEDTAENATDRLRNRVAEEGQRVRENGENARNEAENRIRQQIREATGNGENRQARARQELRNWDNTEQVAEQIRSRVVQNQARTPRFDQNFFQNRIQNNRRNAYLHVVIGNNGRNYPRSYWWQPTPVNTLTGWLGNQYRNPIYVRYGQGQDFYYRNGYAYLRGERYAPRAEYYQQAVRYCREVPDYSQEQVQSMEWKPLGVFALSSAQEEEPSLIVQLAINEEGILSGTFYDEQSEETRPLQGKVDAETQRAVWYFADESEIGIVMETMLFNLSRSETNVLVHFGPEETESWLMVRIPEPEFE